MRALLAAHPTVGHTNALRAIGRRLLSRGHAVAFATTEVRAPKWAPPVVRTAAGIPDALRRDGFEVVPLSLSARALACSVIVPMTRGYTEMRWALRMFGADAVAHARALAETIDRLDVDVVVADYLMVSAWLAARMRRRRFAALYHSALPFPGPERPPFGSGLPFDAPRESWRDARASLDDIGREALSMVRAACRELFLDEPTTHLLDTPYSEDCNLLMTLPELEPGLPPQPEGVHFVGPCLDGRVEDETHPALEALKTTDTRVYVSMGTVFDTDRRVFDAILRGLDRPGVRVVVSAGAQRRALEKRPPSGNALFYERVPQLAVLRNVDLMVTHGGNNSTLETMAAGRPLIVVPFGGDQLENARRVEALGVGVAVLPQALDAERIGSAFEQALSLRAPAAALAGSFEGVDGTNRSVELLEALLP